jgi:hypothetical protein
VVTKIIFGRQQKIFITCARKAGTEYAISTNNIFEYNLDTKKQKNRRNQGYDTTHSFHQAEFDMAANETRWL